jgi:drug/metabolite transporter (DMT)-like permease
MTSPAPPAALLLRLALAIALDTAVQVLWKVGAGQLPGTASVAAAAEAALHQPIFLLVAALFCWQLVNWLHVLAISDLSYSQPITSLSFVSVFAVSAAWLGESVDATKVLGIGLVFAGVWFSSRTGHRTAPDAEAAP